MRIKCHIYLLFAGMFLSSQFSYGQNLSLDKLQNVKVSMLSDSQITEAWKKIQDLGIPEQEAYKLLEKRGMDPIEVNLFKQRISVLGLNKGGVKIAEIGKKEDIDYSRDTVNIIEKPQAVLAVKPAESSELRIYGTDFFNQSALILILISLLPKAMF